MKPDGYKFFVICKLLLFVCIGQVNASQLQVTDAWIPEAPPVARVMAAYLTLNNPSDKNLTLTSVSSPDFKRVEMHRTENKDGMSRMVRQNNVEIPAKGRTEFKPGGLHLMLMQPKRAIKKGDTVMLVLTVDKQTLSVKATVKEATLDDHSAHGHHHHHH